MRTIRYTAAIATVIMSLLNLPIALDPAGAGLAAPVAWLISLLGVAGIVAAIGLFRSAAWATPAVIAVGVLNLIGAIAALVNNSQGAVIGLVLSAVGTALAVTYASSRAARTPRAD
ncbi:hypothetical protein [Dactylosporangium sp. NPDC048998]|uniref:hypothetical protein n=1 Tax=Dactylosporangium sp. NPDC048998 TaxID=3363976 RepID=UPI00371846F5